MRLLSGLNPLQMVKSFRGRSLASSVRSSQEDSAPVLDPATDFYAKVVESRGKGQFLVSLSASSGGLSDSSAASDSSDSTVPVTTAGSTVNPLASPNSLNTPNPLVNILVYMPPKFRNALWIRRGSFVIIRKYEQDKGELLHVLSPEQIKEVKREGKWPKIFENEFAFEATESEDEDEVSEDSSDEYCSSDYGSED